MIFTYCDSLEIKDDILNAFAKDVKTEKDIDTALYLLKNHFLGTDQENIFRCTMFNIRDEIRRRANI